MFDMFTEIHQLRCAKNLRLQVRVRVRISFSFSLSLFIQHTLASKWRKSSWAEFS